MKVGDKLEWLRELEAEGRHVPVLAEEVEVTTVSAPYWKAWSALHHSRRSGGGIPLSEVEVYLRLLGITDADEKLDYMRFIKALDDHYLSKSED